MSQVNLQGPGVAGLPQTLDGPRVPKEMRVNAFADPGPLGNFFNYLPGPLAVDLEDAVIQPQVPIEGKALEAIGQAVRTGYQAGFVAFTPNIENRAPLLGADTAGGQA